MTGAFHPIDIGEWSAQAYLTPIKRILAAIVVLHLAAIGRPIDVGERSAQAYCKMFLRFLTAIGALYLETIGALYLYTLYLNFKVQF